MKTTNPRSSLLCAIVGLLAISLSGCSSGEHAPHASSFAESVPSMVETRVEKLLAQMTLEEKIDYIGGDRGFYIRPIPRLGLPEIKMADGPVGVRNYGPSTAYPAGIALAATWNPELAHEFGAAIGRDSRARGVHILLAPGVNIYRGPLCGRNFEYNGEDPFLASHISTATIRGVQGEGVLATVKHFAANNQEYERHHVSSEVDERTLREIYLPAFESAVKEADVACVMNAYNLINGVHCTQDDWLNNKLLKSEWGFDGLLMSDWVSTYDGVAAANGGLDLEMPSGKYMNREVLIPAIESGKVSVATIDDKVRRILRVIVRAGFLDRTQEDASIPKDDPRSVAVALQIAREGTVLLKNDQQILPLNVGSIKSIAVIGPNASPGVPAGGGSSQLRPFHSVSMVDGIRKQAGDSVRVTYDSGNIFPDIADSASTSRFEHVAADGRVVAGLAAEYFTNIKLTGAPAQTRIDETVNFDWSDVGPEGMPQENFSVRWTGRIRPEADGEHLFMARSDDGIRVWIDGERIIDEWSDHAPRLNKATRTLKAGRTYDVRIEYYQHLQGAVADFSWSRITSDGQATAIAAAKEADVAIVCVGFNSDMESEGGDRAFVMPGDQDRLIEKILEANPNTIVVVNAGGAVDMSRWVDKARAVVHAWYPGQEGGTALAEILFGDVNPSGKLPATFERRAGDNPSFAHYHSADGKTTHYEEGVFVGYRGYDAMNTAPLFSFGHGLSYTTFAYSDLKVATKGHTAVASFTVKNTGTRAGDEVAQLYVGDPQSSVPRPPKELKGFSRVSLKPGESKTVSIELDERAFSFYDLPAHQWKVEPGAFDVLVGASSRDIRLKAAITLE